MSEWIKTKLGDLISIKGGFSYKGEFIGKGESFLLGMGCVSFNDIFLNKGARFYSSETPNSFLVKPGDIVLATRQQSDNLPILGAPAIIPNYLIGKKIIVGTNLYKIENTSKVDNQFLFWLLRTDDYKNHIDSCSKGSTVKMITKDAVESYEFYCPSLDERNRISNLLWRINDKIDLLHRQNTTLEKMVETLFRQWFVEEAKEDWEDTCLKNHVDTLRGLSYKGSGLTEKGQGLPMHNLNSVFEGGGYKIEGIKYYSGDYKERHKVYPGDIIVTNTEQGHEFRLIGFPAIVPKYFGEQGLFSQHIYRIQKNDMTYLSTEYLYYLIMSSEVREQIISATNGSTVNMLAIDGLQRPEFRLPPKTLVESFTKIVSNYWQKKEVNQTQIRTLTALRDTLLPKLMSGETIVYFQ